MRALRASSPVVSVSIANALSANNGVALLAIGMRLSALGGGSIPRSAQTIAQGCQERRSIHACRQLTVHIAQRDPQVPANRRKFALAQRCVDWQQVEVGGNERVGDLECSLWRMQTDLLEAPRQLAARLAPCARIEGRGNGIAIEDGKDQGMQGLELAAAVLAGVRTQHALYQLSHHRKPERISAPSRPVDGIDERLLFEQNLCIMTGARPGVFVDPFLHEESRLRVYEVRERLGIVDGRLAPEQPAPSGA